MKQEILSDNENERQCNPDVCEEATEVETKKKILIKPQKSPVVHVADIDPNEYDIILVDDPSGKSRRKRKHFKCRRCDKMCTSKHSIKYHFLSHTGTRPHQCETCGKGFYASSALHVSLLAITSIPTNCNSCEIVPIGTQTSSFW